MSRHAMERLARPRAARPAQANCAPLLGRLVAVLCALALLTFPGLGLVDLVAAIHGGELAVLRAGYGLLVGFMLPGACLAIAARPDRALAPLQQISVVAGSFVVAAVAGALPSALVGAAGLLLITCVLSLVTATRLRLPSDSPSRPLLLLALLAAVPAVSYALWMSLHQRQGALPYEDFTLGLQGWSAGAAFSTALVLSAVVASFRFPGWLAVALVTAGGACVFGGLVVAYPSLPGSPGPLGGGLAVAWGIAVAVTAAHEACLGRARPPKGSPSARRPRRVRAAVRRQRRWVSMSVGSRGGTSRGRYGYEPPPGPQRALTGRTPRAVEPQTPAAIWTNGRRTLGH